MFLHFYYISSIKLTLNDNSTRRDIWDVPPNGTSSCSWESMEQREPSSSLEWLSRDRGRRSQSLFTQRSNKTYNSQNAVYFLSVKSNCRPPFSARPAVIVPPCRRTAFFTMARPMPVHRAESHTGPARHLLLESFSVSSGCKGINNSAHISTIFHYIVINMCEAPRQANIPTPGNKMFLGGE